MRADPVFERQHQVPSAPIRRERRRLIVQPKSRVGAVRDPEEREADRMADAVLRLLEGSDGTGGLVDTSGSSRIQRSAAGPRTASAAAIAPTSRIQRAAGTGSWTEIGPGGGSVDSGTERSIESARGGGRPLDSRIRYSMEGAFGADLSAVRIHADARADRLNSSINARAFTTGHDIFFRAGEYQPGTGDGRRTLAHELTHVVQQSSRPRSTVAPIRRDWVDDGNGWLVNKALGIRIRKTDNRLFKIGDPETEISDPDERQRALVDLDRTDKKLARTIRNKYKSEAKEAKSAKKAKSVVPVRALDWHAVLNPEQFRYLQLLEEMIQVCPTALDPDTDLDLVLWIQSRVEQQLDSMPDVPGPWIGEIKRRFQLICSGLNDRRLAISGARAVSLAERLHTIEAHARENAPLAVEFEDVIMMIAKLAQVPPATVLGTIVMLAGGVQSARSYLIRLTTTLVCWSSIDGLPLHFEKLMKSNGAAGIRGAVPEVEAAAELVKKGEQNVKIGTEVMSPMGVGQEIDVQTITGGIIHLVEVKADVSALVIKHLKKTGKVYQLDVLLNLCTVPNCLVTIDCRRATGWARLWYSGYIRRLLNGWPLLNTLTFRIEGRTYTKQELLKINTIMLLQMDVMSFDAWVQREMELDLHAPIDLLTSKYAEKHATGGSLTAETTGEFPTNLKKDGRARSGSAPSVMKK